MAAVTTMLVVGAVAASSYVSYTERKEAKKDAKRAANEQRKAQSEQRAQQAAQQAAERRQQIREERVRRAKILQSAQNTGTAGGSGVAGAVGSLSTQLGANIGMNLGAIQASNRISAFMQNAADYNLASQNHMFNADNAQAIGSAAVSIFGSMGTMGGGTGFQANTSGTGTSARAADFSDNMQLYGV